MSLKILLAHSSQEWIDSTKAFFSDLSYEVIGVTNGKDAQVAIGKNQFFASLIDCELQRHSASELLSFIKSRPKKPIVCIFEGEKPLEKQSKESLIKKGAERIFKNEDSLEDIQHYLEGGQNLDDIFKAITPNESNLDELEVESSDEEYTKMKIESFHMLKKVLFDVYIKIGSQKFVKILHRGDSFSIDRLEKYKTDKGVEHLYVNKSDRLRIIKLYSFLSKRAVSNENASVVKKVTLTQTLADKYIEEIHVQGLKPLLVEEGKQICESIYEIIEKDKQLHLLLRDFQNFDPTAYEHSFLVTLYASGIINQFEWRSRSTINNVGLACMFHDIGKTKLDKSLLEKSKNELSDKERKDYYEHPVISAEMLRGNKQFSNNMYQVIAQHHEYMDGTGYPKGNKGTKVTLLSNVVSFVDDFVHKVIDEGLSPVKTLGKMIKDEKIVKRYHSIIIENFIKVFADPGSLKKEDTLPSNSNIIENKKREKF